LFYKSPITLTALTGNGNMFNTRRKLTIEKSCPGPQSQAANTQRLALFLTHLSFCWTQPLDTVSSIIAKSKWIDYLGWLDYFLLMFSVFLFICALDLHIENKKRKHLVNLRKEPSGILHISCTGTITVRILGM
jgi:hypothetical protein